MRLVLPGPRCLVVPASGRGCRHLESSSADGLHVNLNMPLSDVRRSQ